MNLRAFLAVVAVLLLGLLAGLAFLILAQALIRAAPPPATPAVPPETPLTPTATTGPPPLETCPPERVAAAHEAMPPYTPTTEMQFVTVAGAGFAAGGVEFVVRGVNYYPAHSPWRRFLTEATPDTVADDFRLMRAAGLNTLRIFVWHQPLFQCPGSGPTPQPEAFARLDAFIQLAAEAGFRLIVTLNDLPDLDNYPLYTAPAHTQAQMRYIVTRYRDEPAIMAWDLRNEGDIDYRERFDRAQVLAWLEQASAVVRAAAPRQLITAGWLQDANATAPYVDFLSFHHWRSAEELAARIAALKALTDQPILLEEVGYSTHGRSEAEQAALLDAAIAAAEGGGLAGWLVWTAFDFPREATCFPPDCPSPDNQEHHFGLWRVDSAPKLAVDVVRRYTGAP
ncbi:MAG: glycoside hydrolase family 5 protein [Anaerolineae bacterium]|nr:glycoside hydrolase family 5 protein [Anaerolineae bacterium]